MSERSQRQSQVAQVLKRLAAQFLAIESNGISLITVTNATISPDLKNATFSISVLPEEHEEKALAFAKRKRTELRNYIRSQTKMKMLPMLEFEIDMGEKNRQHIDRLIKENNQK